MNLFLVPLLFIFTVQGLIHLAESADGPIVQLKGGKVQGLVLPVGTSGGKVHAFEGIRYGHANRFENPKPAEPWTELFDATKKGHSCPQFSTNHAKNETEDCLFLNVWQPVPSSSDHPSSNLSVMVWIHGGGFTEGSGGADARHLALDGGVVVVGINYRLGPLGFLFAGVGGHEGNYGLHDQVLALHWVKENIAHFGGDPNQVTIFGESAGAFSVSALVLSPLTKGLFKRAILQSGAAEVVTQSRNESLANAHWYAQGMHCPHADAESAKMIECLKEKTLEELHGTNVAVHQPTWGTDLLPTKPSEALLTGKFNQVDLLSGVCNNEGATYVGTMVKATSTVKEVHDEIAKYFGNAQDVADYYVAKLPANPTVDDLKAIVARARADQRFDCAVALFSEQMAKFAPPTAHFYSYRLMQTRHGYLDSWQAVPHGSDVPFIFPDTQLAENQLSKDMIAAWSSFAKSGQPGKMGAVTWAPAFTDYAKPVTQFMALHLGEYKMVAGHYEQLCDVLWKPRILGH